MGRAGRPVCLLVKVLHFKVGREAFLSKIIMWILFLALLLPCGLSAEDPERPELHTTLGEVRGFNEDAGDGLSVDTFYAIPFAQPPVGELRFKSPEPIEPWAGALDGTVLPNSCWQMLDTAYDRFQGVEMWNPNTDRSEDCLYLNVFRPTGGREGPKPIMVWIFGGGFWAGTTTLSVYNATQLAARNDVIVVSIAYRLGILGFLYMGDDEVPGNAGMLDQAMALKWVYDNAANLGGSTEDITIFGESAGAVSVGFHMLSPLTRDLFTYAIMESSSPTCGWAVQTHKLSMDRAKEVAKSVNCSTSSKEEMLACLRKADPDTLSTNQWNVVTNYFDMPFGPVVDFHFLPEWPKKMLDKGDIKVTKVLMGVNKNEGIFFDLYGFMDDFPLDGGGKLTKEQFNTILKGVVPYNDQLRKVKMLYYLDRSLDYEGIIDAVSGDQLFKCPVVNFAQEYSSLGGKVYMYSFEHRMSDITWPHWMGVPHGYEIEAVFGAPLVPGSNFTQAERRLSSKIMDFWTTFAATGNPNPEGTDEWPKYSFPFERYLELKADSTTVHKWLRKKECAFWKWVESD